MINLRGELIIVPISLKFRILHIILWLSPAIGVLVTAILVESIVVRTACQKFGVSAGLGIVQAINASLITIAIAIFWIAIRTYVSQIQSKLINIGNGIPFKDIASWVSLHSPLDLFKSYKSGTLGLWIVFAGLIATLLSTSSRLTYTIGDVSLGFHNNAVQTAPDQSLLQGTVCGATCIDTSPTIISGRFDSLAASQNATSEGTYITPDGFTIYLPPPSFYGTGTTTIKRRGIIGGKISCNQQSTLPSTIFVDDLMTKDRVFHSINTKVFIIATTMSSNMTGGLQWTTALYQYKNGTALKVSTDGYYTICNATAQVYDVTAHATSNDTWEKTSMIKNLDKRLVYTEGDIQLNGSLIPFNPTNCKNCDFIGTENGNTTMALAFGGKVRALIYLLAGYANIGFDGKGYPLPSDIWLGTDYSRYLDGPGDAARVINRFQNRFMIGLSEVNKVPDGMKVELQVEEKYTCVINRWPVIYTLLVLSGLIGLIGCYYILSMKSKFIDIGPKSLLAIGTTYETQQILRGTKVLGEKNMDVFNNRKLCLVNIDHQNVALSFNHPEK
ncbi:hypothetical protein F8M41_014133 [Gigaspora margarita]|uniref:Uncharacterized protein n=1 Tax=Gigaspora margarita TaxID=4874 RepID=A0A8H4ENX6_GIGMA|nr:hypothetical protein F8M41_014133 [Gigaspora margarita]